MRSDKWIVQIGPYRVAVDRTLSGDPAIFYGNVITSDAHVTNSPGDIGAVTICGHLLPPDPAPERVTEETP